MAEDLTISGETKEEIYSSLIPQIKALIGNETDLIANLANVAAALKEGFHFFWVGFYLGSAEKLSSNFFTKFHTEYASLA